MSFKFAVGAVIAVMAGAFMLPGIASAHHPIIDGDSGCNNDGSWHVDFTVGNSENSPGDLTSLTPGGGGYVDDGRDMRIEEISASDGVLDDGVEAGDIVQNGDTVGPEGTIDDIDNGTGETMLTVEGYWRYFVDGNIQGGATVVNEERSKTFYAPDFDPCRTTDCESGDFVTDFIDFVDADDSCETLQRCDEGQSLTVTQHELDTDADLSDSTAGDCPTDEPITQIVLVVEPEPEAEPEAEVESAVIEVAAALPSAGYGDTAGASFAWTALAAVALLSIGGGVAVVARRN
jgi:hypothetical protein